MASADIALVCGLNFKMSSINLEKQNIKTNKGQSTQVAIEFRFAIYRLQSHKLGFVHYLNNFVSPSITLHMVVTLVG